MTSDQEQLGDNLAESYIQHELMNEPEHMRGRRLGRSSDQDVLDVWVATFERWFEHRTIENTQNMDDAAAELRSRDLQAPYEQVRPKIDVLRTEIERLAPDAQPEGLDQRVKDFLAWWSPF